MEPEIWLYYRGFYKVYTEDYEAMKKITSWQGCKRSCIYSNYKGQVFGWDLIFPSRLYNKVAKTVGLPLRAKNPNRVSQGKKLGQLAKENDFLGLQNNE
jgi:hypothetical protein